MQSQVFQATLSIVFETPVDLEFVEGALYEYFKGWNNYLKKDSMGPSMVIVENVRTAKVTEWIPPKAPIDNITP